jgi:hypothetical protein
LLSQTDVASIRTDVRHTASSTVPLYIKLTFYIINRRWSSGTRITPNTNHRKSRPTAGKSRPTAGEDGEEIKTAGSSFTLFFYFLSSCYSVILQSIADRTDLDHDKHPTTPLYTRLTFYILDEEWCSGIQFLFSYKKKPTTLKSTPKTTSPTAYSSFCNFGVRVRQWHSFCLSIAQTHQRLTLRWC